MKKKFYAGIDLSLTGTAIVILDDEFKVFSKELIPTKSSLELVDRLKFISNRISEIVNIFIDSELYVNIEGYAFGVKNSRMFDLAELGGIVKYISLQNKPHIKKILITPPTSLKKFITSSGNSKKEIMMKEIYKKYDFDTNDNNIADAFALAVFCYNYVKNPSDLFAYQKESLNSASNLKILLDNNF